MELRCAWRSTNISETSRFEYSISYILRLMAVSSTEETLNAAFCPRSDHQLKHRLDHVALPTKDHAYSSIFRNNFWRQALHRPSRSIRPATGESPTASPTSGSHNATATCGARWPGSRRRAAATSTIPMSQNRAGRPSGMPILIDMKKKAGVDQWEGQVYNAKDGQFYSSTIKPVEQRSSRNPGLRARLPLRRRNLDPRRAPDSLEPRQQHGQGRDRRPRRAAQGGGGRRPEAGCSGKDHRRGQPATEGAKTGSAQPADSVGDICLLPDIAGFTH